MVNIYNSLKKIVVILICFFPLCLTAQPPIITYEPFPVGALNAPVDIVNAGDGSNRLIIVEQGGTIKVWDVDTLIQLINIGATGANLISYSPGGERGLLSMAFHPDYDGVTNRFFFVYYTDVSGNIAIRRFETALGNIDSAVVSTGTSIITIPHPGESNHNGGKLNFGRDGYLYFATGDGGGGNDGPNNAQNGDVLLGKMLRINIDTTTANYGNYGVPSTNPYLNDINIDDRIWALGLRNPFRWSFDSFNGNMWIGDVGQGAQEEISFRPAGFTGHVNYGWRCFEGYPSTPGVPDCTPSDYVPPVYDYPNPASGASAVTGGYVYRGSEFDTLRGYYIAADVYSGQVFLLWPNGTGGFDSSVQTTPLSFVVGFGEAENGTLYAVSQGTNSIYKVVGTGGVVLPVSLAGFTASKLNGYNEIKWNTASEINTARFYIEYSTDGRNFSRVGTVAANRNANGSSYYFNHYINYTGDMFYRLTIEDDNGAKNFSSIIRLNGGKQNNIRIMPTLVNNRFFNLEVLIPAQSLKIINIQGAIVYKRDLKGLTGTSVINLPALSKGMYIVEVTSNNGMQTEKIMVQ